MVLAKWVEGGESMRCIDCNQEKPVGTKRDRIPLFFLCNRCKAERMRQQMGRIRLRAEGKSYLGYE